MMLTKSLFCALMHARGLTVLTRTKVFHHFSKSTSFTDKVTYFSTKYHEDEKFHSDCKSYPVPSKILQLLESDQTKVNSSDIIAALSALLNGYDQKTLEEDFYKQDFFKNLCFLTQSNMTKLQMSEAIQILNILNKLNVPSSSKIILSLLRHIDSLLNSSSLQDFNTLWKIILKMTPSGSTKSMMKNLNSRFIVKFSTDFDVNDLDFLSNALEYTSRHLRDKRIPNIIIQALQNNNFETATVWNAISLIKSLCYMQIHPSGWLQILNQSYNVLIDNIQSLAVTDILTILQKTSYKIKYDRLDEFYNETLFDMFAQRIISDDVGLKLSIVCLEKLNVARHVHKELLNYICAKYYEEKMIAHNDIPYETEKLFYLITGLANLKFKPIFWKEIYESLQVKKILAHKYETVVTLSLNLACLDFYNQSLLNRIFRKGYTFSKSTTPAVQWILLKLWQRLNMIDNYDGPWPSPKQIEMFEKLQPKTNESFLNSLEQAMGGSTYVKNSLKTKLYHHIDAVVAFRSGGYPIAINDTEKNDTETINRDIKYLEDLTIPPNCQLLVILFTLSSWYSRNTGKMLGPYSVYIESLEAMSYPVLTINLKTWYGLEENAKIPFLMNKINSKLKADENC